MQALSHFWSFLKLLSLKSQPVAAGSCFPLHVIPLHPTADAWQCVLPKVQDLAAPTVCMEHHEHPSLPPPWARWMSLGAISRCDCITAFCFRPDPGLSYHIHKEIPPIIISMHYHLSKPLVEVLASGYSAEQLPRCQLEKSWFLFSSFFFLSKIFSRCLFFFFLRRRTSSGTMSMRAVTNPLQRAFNSCVQLLGI